MEADLIERVASPAEFERLLSALPLDLALPYALAGYGIGRRAQIIRLRRPDVDLDIGAIEWGVEVAARKYEASRHVVPTGPSPFGPAQTAPFGAGPSEGGTGVPIARGMGHHYAAEHRLGGDPCSPRVGEGKAPADHAAGSPPNNPTPGGTRGDRRKPHPAPGRCDLCPET